MSRRKHGLDIHGVVLLDKPVGISSNRALQKVRGMFKARKGGHTGSLDPFATGMLPICLGEASKTAAFMLEAGKRYLATARLGEATTTGDVEGQIIKTCPLAELDSESITRVFNQFVGQISQIPPMYSALKKDGVPLYKLARQGQIVEREPRTVEISRLEVLSVDLPDVVIEVDCSKGTYIRTLAQDLGDALGCGAHITQLRRLSSGPFTIDECVTLDALAECPPDENRGLLTVEQSLMFYPAVSLTESAAKSLRYGVPPEADNVALDVKTEAGSLVRLMDGDQLLAMAHYAPAREREKRGDFELVRVFLGS
jgi:tRNA pseudouridine55 synthase